MNDRLGFTILLLVGGITLVAFHALRRPYVSSSMYSSIAAGVLCTIAWTAMVRMNGIMVSISWDDWHNWLVIIAFIAGMTLWHFQRLCFWESHSGCTVANLCSVQKQMISTQDLRRDTIAALLLLLAFFSIEQDVFGFSDAKTGAILKRYGGGTCALKK